MRNVKGIQGFTGGLLSTVEAAGMVTAATIFGSLFIGALVLNDAYVKYSQFRGKVSQNLNPLKSGRKRHVEEMPGDNVVLGTGKEKHLYIRTENSPEGNLQYRQAGRLRKEGRLYEPALNYSTVEQPFGVTMPARNVRYFDYSPLEEKTRR